MSTKQGQSTRLAVVAVLLYFAFGVPQAGIVQGLPPAQSPALLVVSQSGRGGAAEMASSDRNLAPAIVYVSGDRHIHEIVLKGAWQDSDLTAAAGAPRTHTGYPEPMAYRRSDGVSMVIYRGEDNHIHSLYLQLVRQGNIWQEIWTWADLSAITGSPAAASDPYGYVRSDGINAVVYVGWDGRIHDLRLETVWIWADLTAISGAPVADNDLRPFPYIRGDGINAIVYQGVAAQGGNIYELRLDNGWQWANLSSFGAPRPMSDLAAYVRSDGISTITYACQDGHIQELRLETTWISADLTAISGAPETWLRPFGYVRSDGTNAIVYSAVDMGTGHLGHIYELWLDNGWEAYALTSVPNAVLGYNPVGYVRVDGISAVVYRGIDDHIHEIRLETAWEAADLTFLAGASTARGAPWPYNRSVVARVYLPLLIRGG